MRIEDLEMLVQLREEYVQIQRNLPLWAGDGVWRLGTCFLVGKCSGLDIDATCYIEDVINDVCLSFGTSLSLYPVEGCEDVYRKDLYNAALYANPVRWDFIQHAINYITGLIGDSV